MDAFLKYYNNDQFRFDGLFNTQQWLFWLMFL